MLDRKKVNPALGEDVHKYLLEKGVETPMIEKLSIDKVGVFTSQKSIIADAFRTIMEALCLDLTDDSLMETPRRMAKMYVDELYAGLDYNNFPKITAVENKMNYNTMLLERHIAVKSTCVPGKQAVCAVGKRKLAREVSVGDKLWTLCNGIPVQTTVSAVSSHKADSIVRVTLSNGVKFMVTPDHPLKVKDGWVEAIDSLGK